MVAGCYSEYLLRPEDRKAAAAAQPPDAGLGMLFRYPGDAKKLRDRAKMRLWGEYLRDNGRNATLVRQPTFHKLIRVGLPNRLRGEMWELTSGSLHLRLENPTLYGDTLARFHGQESLAIDEIEKDLNRSLPEYPGFQSEEGIGRLRRVLTAYSWVNADVGYCQAMNIVVAALLIYMSEAQAFFLLSTLCDRLVPGYYSTTMYGTLLDQRVFESLVEKTMPVLWEHLVRSDVQLSVVSLPWFLSLYINSMPLVFAFRVLDVFFVEGPKVLFQVGLAILRINGEELLDAADDGAFISVLKSYFVRLDESAHPRSENAKLRAVTRFQELMVVAFKEFSGITHSSIAELRLKNKDAVLSSIETFAKRTALRNLGPDSKLLSTDELGGLYDRFWTVLYEREQRDQQLTAREAAAAAKTSTSTTANRPSSRRDGGGNGGNNGSSSSSSDHSQAIEKGRVGLGASTSRMDYDAFREFLAGMAKWAIADAPPTPRRDTFGDGVRSPFFRDSLMPPTPYYPPPPWGDGPEPADHEFMQRLFRHWDVDSTGTLSLHEVVSGMARIKGKRDIMGAISYFFELYDDRGDGKVDREGILRISESLLFLSRRGLEGSLSPSNSSAALNRGGAGGGADYSATTSASGRQPPPRPLPGISTNERFLGSVSAFIRRCFEYADPDRPKNSDYRDTKETTEAPGDPAGLGLADPSSFAIGDDDEEDEEEDLLALDSPTGSPKPVKRAASRSATTTTTISTTTTSTTASTLETPSIHTTFDGGDDGDDESRRKVSRAQSEKANVALDPGNPLYMTLPTFRMVVLADELLEQFFESSFPTSFHVVEGLQLPALASPSALTTFSSLRLGGSQLAPPAAAGRVAPPRGLRGVLDNIVTDGMRVAAEVRKRVEDVQREIEKNAFAGQQQQQPRRDQDDDDDDDDGPRSSAVDTERRSVRSEDRDLLEGADAEAADAAGTNDGGGDPAAAASTRPRPRVDSSASTKTERIVEFDA